jgi:hypothetical protein
MPDSPRQLLQAIAVALTEEVAPHVDDPFAQMQCKAAAELLANLAGELDWAPALREAGNEQLRTLRDALRRCGWPGAEAGSASDSDSPPARDGVEATRAALLAELREGMAWLADTPEEAATEVDQLLRADLDQQVAALRRGMFR